MSDRYRNVFFLLFALSGFSGLIYESIWTHYLKLFLGHAAYAQTLVLAIFMGGLTAGSFLCSRYSARWRNLLAGYAAAEAAVGLSALLFHPIFTRAVDVSYATVLPRLGDPALISAYKWTLSALLILPQTVLLGMTFPLMSAGILRLFPERPGRSVSLLYFTNSIGAAAGVLLSGFVLIRLLGLPGTMAVAGVVNLALALAVWLLVRRVAAGEVPEGIAATAEQAPAAFRLFLAVSLLTGTASFIYEIGWIRMLSLVLGSSTHAFELMLSAFISGLACGGLWLQRRIDRIPVPVRFLAAVQLVMGLLALSTLVLYGRSFEIMQWLVANLPKTDPGYTLFNLSSSGIAMAIMFPATFCAGMTLPLITYLLLRQGCGERVIGAVYAANTVGAIVGVFFAIHLRMPLMGLKGVICFGAALDLALGLVLIWNSAARAPSRKVPAAATVLVLAALAATVTLVDLDIFKMGSGVYRDGMLLPRSSFQNLYHSDSKTATVDVFVSGLGSMRINTNGKTDAAVQMDPGRPAEIDESTMVLLGAIPMALHPEAKTAAVIGFGCGLTSHTLLANPQLERVDTVEIEPGMVEAARNFRPNNELAFSDPRSRIHFDDAKTFFSTQGTQYDLIISEPSNPWVSGVSGLFSEEFYRLVRRSMKDDALFVQWVQLYEIDVELVVSVLKAISGSFDDYAVYAPNESDMMIVATKKGAVPELGDGVFRQDRLAALLKRVQVERLNDLAVRKVGGKKALGGVLASFPVRANSDYYPVLDQNAARTRFLNRSAVELIFFSQLQLPTAELLSGSAPTAGPTEVTPTMAFTKTKAVQQAMALREFFLRGRFDPKYGDIPDEDRNAALQLKRMFHEPGAVRGEEARLTCLFYTAENLVPFLSPGELEAIWRSLERGAGATSLSVRERQSFELLKAVSRRDAPAMARSASVLLADPPGLAPASLRYAAASGMLGYLMQGKREESYRLWSRCQEALFGSGQPDLLFRLLVGESLRGA